MNPGRWIGLCSSLLLAACSASAPEGATPEVAGAGEERPPDDESERDRTIRLAKEKRAQCDTLADTIQAEPEIDVIANIHDSAALERVAATLEQSVKVLEALTVSDSILAEQHAAYIGILRGKAAALRAVAATKDDADKKQQLRTFQKHDEAVASTIDAINQACSSAPGTVPEPAEDVSGP